MEGEYGERASGDTFNLYLQIQLFFKDLGRGVWRASEWRYYAFTNPTNLQRFGTASMVSERVEILTIYIYKSSKIWEVEILAIYIYQSNFSLKN